MAVIERILKVVPGAAAVFLRYAKEWKAANTLQELGATAEEAAEWLEAAIRDIDQTTKAKAQIRKTMQLDAGRASLANSITEYANEYNACTNDYTMHLIAHILLLALVHSA